MFNRPEHVVALDVGATWQPNAPEALFLQLGQSAFVVLHAHCADSDTRDVVLVFEGFKSAVVGGPNDEAHHGHRLWESGLSKCLWAGEVFASSYIDALEQSNRVHPYHNAARFAELRHFILLLKEGIFECVARDVLVRRSDGARSEILTKILNQAL